MITQQPNVDATASPGAQGAPERSRWAEATEHAVRHAAAGVLAGLVSGFLVAGVGGRIAMRVVAVQTGARHQGLTTDDGAVTGDITLGGSASLIAFLTLAGVLGSLLHVVVRPHLPERHRALTWGLVTGAVGASLVVDAEGVDYTLLGSPWVSVAMFSGLCLAYGAVTAAVADRLLRPGGLAQRAAPGRLAVSFAVLLPGLAIVPVAGAGAVAVVLRATGLPPRSWHPTATLAVRAALVLAVVVASADLAGTVRALA